MSKLRIGLVTAFPPGKNSLNEFGYQMVTQMIPKEEVDSIVVFCDETYLGLPENIDGVEFVPCWKFNSLKNAITISRAVRKAKVDFLLFNLQFASFGDTKLAGGAGLLTPMLARRILGIPTGVVLHNLVENVDMADAGFASNKIVGKAMEFAGRMLTRLILTADYVALTIPKYVKQLQDGYGATNAILAPHGTFEEIPEPEYGIGNPPRLIAFGKWGTYKKVDELVAAYRLLVKQGFSDLEIEIAGTDSPNAPGYLAGVQTNVEPGERIDFSGYIEEEDVAPMFLNSDIAVFPYSSTTGSSGVLHQAGSYGLPVVLPDIGDFSEVIESEGFIGQYFEPENAESLAEAIAYLLTNHSTAIEMAERNYRAAAGIPFHEVMDWHLIHIQRILTERSD